MDATLMRNYKPKIVYKKGQKREINQPVYKVLTTATAVVLLLNFSFPRTLILH
jgi:hypothetical protein